VTKSLDDKELEKIKENKMKKMLNQPNPGVVKLTSTSFDSFVNNDMPVLVDFWADWCMPCRMMAPVMDALAKEYAGKALFGKVNVDENPQIASRYGIMSIPHFLLFKNGTNVDKIVGAVGRNPLENAIKKHL
jgi:thioredoxin 1